MDRSTHVKLWGTVPRSPLQVSDHEQILYSIDVGGSWFSYTTCARAP